MRVPVSIDSNHILSTLAILGESHSILTADWLAGNTL
jgi:hypothetical protein